MSHTAIRVVHTSCALALWIVMVAMHGSALAQSAARPPYPPPAGEAAVNFLARDVERAQSLRDVKDLTQLYAQYGQYGLWDEMGALFAANAEYIDDGRVMAKTPTGIAAWLRKDFGYGNSGLPKGGVFFDMMMQPIVTLSFDGGFAQSRWHDIMLTGNGAGEGRWDVGARLIDYVREGDAWKIARVHFYHDGTGKAEDGFKANKAHLPLVPYHFTPATAGRPVPDTPAGMWQVATSKLTLEQIERKIARLNDANAVRNLQNVLMYYSDRKMWSDMVDVFTVDGVLEVAEVGVWKGAKNVRRGLERDGPEGLMPGEVHDQIQVGMTVTLSPDGGEARVRGMQWGFLTPKMPEAYWQASTFVNRYIKGADGKWRVREMRVFPQMTADYYQGWGRNNVATLANAIPAFDATIAVPVGQRLVANDRLVRAPAALQASAALSGTVDERVAAARVQLEYYKAYDAIENISSAFGLYLDDNLWDEMSALLAVDGTRPQGTGFYVGRDKVYRAMTQSHWDGPPSPAQPRDAIRMHHRFQPVIMLDASGRSAKVRARLLTYSIRQDQPGSFNNGIYPNDTAVLEDGVWKLRVAGEIDETYFSSRNFKEGWARPSVRTGGVGGPPTGGDEGGGGSRPRPTSRSISGITNTIEFAPDVPWSRFAKFRRKDWDKGWPNAVRPMWFAYRNPVSDREPPFYCPELFECMDR